MWFSVGHACVHVYCALSAILGHDCRRQYACPILIVDTYSRCGVRVDEKSRRKSVCSDLKPSGRELGRIGHSNGRNRSIDRR